MKSDECPHCAKKISFNKRKELMTNNIINCPFCNQSVKVNRRFAAITMVCFGTFAGIMGGGIYKIPMLEITTFMFLFAFVYSIVHAYFIGIFFPLVKAKDKDSLL